MNLNLTEIAFVMDRSGSMESMKREAIGGFNTFVDKMKTGPGEVRLTLILFDHEYLKVIDNQPISIVLPLDDNNYEPRGTTALLDAMGRTIDEVGKRLAKTPEHDRPGQVIIACMTDGAENASHTYSNMKIAQMIEHQKTVYNWEFEFLGANLESCDMAKSWGLDDQSVAFFDATSEGQTQAFLQMSAKMSVRRKAHRTKYKLDDGDNQN